LVAVLDLLADGALRVEPLVTHRFPIERALEAYALISEGKEPYLGVLLEYGADEQAAQAPAPGLRLRREPKAKQALGIGVIGAGGFGQSVLLPALRAAGGVDP